MHGEQVAIFDPGIPEPIRRVAEVDFIRRHTLDGEVGTLRGRGETIVIRLDIIKAGSTISCESVC